MKKILFLFMMFMGLMSSLHAMDTGQIGCDVEKSQTLSETDGVTFMPESIASGKVIITQRDTLIYGLLLKGQENIRKISLAKVPQIVCTNNSLGYVLSGEYGV